VVITTSKSPMRSCNASCCAARSSSVNARAYPPTPEPSPIPANSRNRAPTDRTSSRVSGRMSYPVTTAPNRRAVPIADSPATPTPSTSTWAGFAVPAAVISIGK
jgi:hypothetical protein